VDDEIGYADWGLRFFTQAVTVERVLAGINVLSGQPIDVGPMGVGPGRVVKVTARGAICEAVGERLGTDPVRFAVGLPVTLRFTFDLGVDKHRFDAAITVPLAITARARADLAIVLDVTPPTPQQVDVRLTAQGLRASIMQHAANIEGELRRFVARYVARELDKPYVVAARVIDVSRAIDRAIASLAPQRTAPPEAAQDLDRALAAEIRQTELFVEPPMSDGR
jgi:hypothetical protein